MIKQLITKLKHLSITCSFWFLMSHSIGCTKIQRYSSSRIMKMEDQTQSEVQILRTSLMNKVLLKRNKIEICLAVPLTM